MFYYVFYLVVYVVELRCLIYYFVEIIVLMYVLKLNSMCFEPCQTLQTSSFSIVLDWFGWYNPKTSGYNSDYII